MIHENYKILLFDIGGVIIDIDPSITENKFKELSNSRDDNFKGLDYRYEKVSSDLTTLFINYEQGFITDSEFRDGLRQIGSIDMPDKDIDNIWNLVIVKLNKSLLDGINENTYMYFVHSFKVMVENDEIKTSIAIYGSNEICTSIEYKNIYATQFHPEKSSEEGLKIYKNFKNIIRSNE